MFRKYIPKRIRNLRHLFYAWWGAVKYKHPSEELFVIGVTGTSGKSTTVALLRQLLEAAGYTVGSLSTIDFYIAGHDMLNDQKMTMLGKMQIQKYLRDMVNANCDVAIVETTSEGAVQHRHKFINYDTIVLTNLYPEHIESHGSFENYMGWKKKIVDAVCNGKKKYRMGQYKKIVLCNPQTCPDKVFQRLPKTAIINGNIDQAKHFLNNNCFVKYVFGRDDAGTPSLTKKIKKELAGEVMTKKVSATKDGLAFTIGKDVYSAKMYGEHNVMNITAAITVAQSMGIEQGIIQKAVSQFTNVPGRIEFIPEAEEKGFRVVVDYAFEPVALEKLFEVVKKIEVKGRILHVCGSTGGGRDKSRREPIGQLVAKHADMFYVTDEDPYDEDPMEIIKTVSAGAQKAGMKKDKNVFEILDRKEAIEEAIAEAKKDDLVIITGKGSEQAMVVAGGKLIPWDDREIARTAIEKKK